MEYIGSKTEKKCYIILNILLVIGVIIYFFFHKELKVLQQSLPKCFWQGLTGYNCPGCGGTRALNSLIHFHLWESFCYHPFVLYSSAITGIFWVTKTIEYISGEKIKGIRLRAIYFYLALGIIIVQWIVKNLIVYMEGYNYLL